MNFSAKIKTSQKILNESLIDGWLLYDFRKTNDLACSFLNIQADQLFSRRFFYWIPKKGLPIKIIHQIEPQTLQYWPGEIFFYKTWEELQTCLRKVLDGSKTIAMEYSPCNAIPYISKVDAGTVELIRSFGVDVVSSADLLQHFTSIWSPQKLKSHFESAAVLEQAVDAAWKLISHQLKHSKKITEHDVQNFLLEKFDQNGCISDYPPMCAVNEHSANPHFFGHKANAKTIKQGDFILIDLWCKKKTAHSVYADITQVGVASDQPTEKQQQIFNVVKQARDAAMTFLKDRLSKGQNIKGWEVDAVCREKIINAGFGPYFTHRTGHNLGENVHGNGANIDNFETKDYRTLLPGSCFTIEPGIYLPDEFGVRLEHDVYLEKDGKGFQITGALQKKIVRLL